MGLPPQCIVGESVRATLDSLEDHGLDRACIPVAMGGDYFYYQQFNQWICARLSIEDAMVCAPPRRNRFVAKRMLTAPNVASEGEDSGDGKLLIKRRPGESLSDFESRRTYFYGQRSYAKKKRKVDELNDQCRVLENTRSALQTEHRRLEALLKDAAKVLGPFEACSM